MFSAAIYGAGALPRHSRNCGAPNWRRKHSHAVGDAGFRKELDAEMAEARATPCRPRACWCWRNGDLTMPSGRGILALLSGLAEEERTRIHRRASRIAAIKPFDVPFADARNSRGQFNPSKAAFKLTAWQVRPILAAMVRSERPGLP